MTTRKRLFGGATNFQILATVISLMAGALSLITILLSGSLFATGVEQNLTQGPLDGWTIFLALMLVIMTIMFINSKRKK